MPSRRRPSPEALVAWEAFLRAHLEVVQRLDADLVEAHSIPLAWYDVLVQLNQAGGEATMGVLAERLLISPSTCTRVVERMTTAGLVERRIDTVDARIRHAHLTEAGRAMLRAAAVTHLAGIERHFAALLPDGLPAELTALFAAMSESVAGERP